MKFNFLDFFQSALPRALTNQKPRRGDTNLERRYGVEPKPAPKDRNSEHPQSVLAGKIWFRLPRIIKALNGRAKPPSQHDRVVAGRARRMGLTVAEYERRFN